ncbi:MAG: tyrosine-type recombinase/integrase [Lachnospiraceae bacterium]|nr:tyrosine-type recombinase/integrase [Lachnospiraceae bacterium]
MAEAGIDPKVLQYVMGHADIGVTMSIYNHVSGKDRVVKEMAKLDAVI